MKTVEVAETCCQYRLDCPKCGWVYWFSDKQYHHPRFFMVCDICGTSFKPNRPKELEPPHEKTDLIAAVIDVVVTFGFSKKEAEYNVNKVYDKNKTFEQLVKDAVSL